MLPATQQGVSAKGRVFTSAPFLQGAETDQRRYDSSKTSASLLADSLEPAGSGATPPQPLSLLLQG